MWYTDSDDSDSTTEESETYTQESEESETYKTHYLMEVRNQTVFCKICEVKVPGSLWNIQQHINGRNHKREYYSLLDTNEIKIIDFGFYCDICKVTIEETFEIDHIDSSGHINKLNDYYCEVCDVRVPNNQFNIEQHNYGQRHLDSNEIE